jgi:hypothetical protein
VTFADAMPRFQQLLMSGADEQIEQARALMLAIVTKEESVAKVHALCDRARKDAQWHRSIATLALG